LETNENTRQEPGKAGIPALPLTIAVVVLFVTLMLVRLSSLLPPAVANIARWPARLIRTAVGAVFTAVGAGNAATELKFAAYLLVTAGALPWLAAWALGRGRPGDIGTRWPNRYAPRIIAIAYLVSLPFVYWMTQSESMAGRYLEHWRRCGPVIFLVSYLVNMVTEHFLLHGVVLGLCRREMRWPAAPPVRSHTAPGGDPLSRLLRWIGMAQPTEDSRWTSRARQWLGLPEGCVAAMITSAVLFGLVHLGKDTRELMLSFPGGLAQAYVAYRTNSWLTPFVLHLATATTALGMMAMQ
jgi:hypothetical protein